MASRPYLNHRGLDLLAVFEGDGENASTLKAFRAELIHRNTPSMRDLRTQVDQALAQFEAAPAMPSATRPALSGQRQPELPLDTGEAPSTDRHSAPSRTLLPLLVDNTFDVDPFSILPIDALSGVSID